MAEVKKPKITEKSAKVPYNLNEGFLSELNNLLRTHKLRVCLEGDGKTYWKIILDEF